MTDDMWGTGDFKAVAEKIATAGETLVEAAGVEPGMDVLDVGCGTGNATIPAAKLGARVTGLDASPGLIEIARELGADAMSSSTGSWATPSRCRSRMAPSTA
jgi:2-polyprenyl-3-methyl-5-hydroxy-6-metoxy-1,4-benzoquinol methylase